MSKSGKGKSKKIDIKVNRRERPRKYNRELKNRSIERRRHRQSRQGRRDYSKHLKNPLPVMVFSTSELMDYAASFGVRSAKNHSPANTPDNNSKGLSVPQKLMGLALIVTGFLIFLRTGAGGVGLTPETAGTAGIVSPGAAVNSGNPLAGGA